MGYQHVLVAVDLSEHSKKVLDYSRLKLAPIADKMTIISIFYDWMPPDLASDYVPNTEALIEYREAKLANATRDLAKLVTPFFGEEGAERKVIAAVTPIYRAILEEAEREDADLIVMGTHGSGALTNLFIGSTLQRLLRESKRPVLVAP